LAGGSDSVVTVAVAAAGVVAVDEAVAA